MIDAELATIRLHILGRSEVESWIQGALAGADLRHLTTVNPEFIVAAVRRPDFATVLTRSDAAVCDGAGLVWAAKIIRGIDVDRLTGADLVEQLLTHPPTQTRVFLLGSTEETQTEIARRYPNAPIVGHHGGGAIDAQTGQGSEDDAVITTINASGANVLLVAFGHPKQELWINRYRHQIPMVRVAVGVGGTFDYLSGRVPRAPRLFRQMGLEWLYRLFRQPWRWRRIMDAVVVFPIIVASDIIRTRFKR